MVNFLYKKKLALYLKIIVTSGILFWMGGVVKANFSKIPFDSISYVFFICAVVSLGGSYLVLFVRWKLLLSLTMKMDLWLLARCYYVGVFSNNFMPSSVGGDLVRASMLYKEGGNPKDLVSCGVVDRILGMISTLIYGAVFFLLAGANHLQLINSKRILVLCMVVLLFIFLLFFLSFIFQHASFSVFQKIIDRVDSVLCSFKVVFMAPKTLLVALLISFFSTFFVALSYYFLSLAFLLDISLSIFMFVVPISFISSAIPISVGGLGVREGTIVFVLGAFSVPLEQSISVAVSYLLALMLVSLPGAIFIFYKPSRSTFS